MKINSENSLPETNINLPLILDQHNNLLGRQITELEKFQETLQNAELIKSVVILTFSNINPVYEKVNSKFKATPLIVEKPVIQNNDLDFKEIFSNSLPRTEDFGEIGFSSNHVIAYFTRKNEIAPGNLFLPNYNGKGQRLSDMDQDTVTNLNTNDLMKLGILLTHDENHVPVLHFNTQEEAIKFRKNNSQINIDGQMVNYHLLIIPSHFQTQLSTIIQKSIEKYIAYRMNLHINEEKKKEEKTPTPSIYNSYLSTYIFEKEVEKKKDQNGENLKLLNIIPQIIFTNISSAEILIEKRRDEEKSAAKREKNIRIEEEEIRRDIRKKEIKDTDIENIDTKKDNIKNEIKGIPPVSKPPGD